MWLIVSEKYKQEELVFPVTTYFQLADQWMQYRTSIVSCILYIMYRSSVLDPVSNVNLNLFSFSTNRLLIAYRDQGPEVTHSP